MIVLKQVVGADVEDFCHADDHVCAWGVFAVLVAADLSGVGVEAFG